MQPMVTIAVLFFIFGFVTWLNGPLITFVKLAFDLDDVNAFLVPMAFYLSYFFLALPASAILRKTGMKAGMALGLFTMAAGAFGIANEKRWGYIVGIVAAGVQLAALLLLVVQVGININVLISLLFDGALVALLVHPQSREYQKVWFR